MKGTIGQGPPYLSSKFSIGNRVVHPTILTINLILFLSFDESNTQWIVIMLTIVAFNRCDNNADQVKNKYNR